MTLARATRQSDKAGNDKMRNREKSRDRWARLKGALWILLQQEKIQDGETVSDVPVFQDRNRLQLLVCSGNEKQIYFWLILFVSSLAACTQRGRTAPITIP